MGGHLCARSYRRPRSLLALSEREARKTRGRDAHKMSWTAPVSRKKVMLFFMPARADVPFRRDCLCHNHASVRSLIDVVPMHKLVQRLNKVMDRNLKNELGGNDMLWTIAVILLVLWAVGLISSYTIGGFIHLLLLAAIIVVLIRIIQGRRPI